MDNKKKIQLSVTEYAKNLVASNYYLVDVREPWEVELASLPNAINIPLENMPEKMQILPQDRELIVFCHHGVRSLGITQMLREHGYFARSLKGGINAYALEIDPSVATY